MGLKFKQCQLRDLEDLITISRNTFIEAFEKDNNALDFKNYIDEAFNVENIERQLKHPESRFYFAILENQVIGYFKINKGIAQTEDFKGNCIELERIYVKAEHQNRGFGEELLKFAITLGKRDSHEFIWLGVWQKNVHALRFYERFGFKKIGTHPYYIGDDKQIDWLMRLDLL